MNIVIQQQDIITELYHLVRRSAPEKYTEAACRFEYFKENDGSCSVEEKFWYFIAGERVSTFLDDDPEVDIMALIPQLHEIMRNHTGGDWNAFTLTIDQSGKSTTKFEYPDENITV